MTDAGTGISRISWHSNDSIPVRLKSLTMGWRPLEALSGLQWLYLDRTKITDAGFGAV